MTAYAWFDKGDGRQVYRRVPSMPAHRSDLPCPALISDQIEIRSMVDGQTYTSKSALRRSYRRHGVTEVGNEEMKAKAPVQDRKAIRTSIEKACARVGI